MRHVLMIPCTLALMGACVTIPPMPPPVTGPNAHEIPVMTGRDRFTQRTTMATASRDVGVGKFLLAASYDGATYALQLEAGLHTTWLYNDVRAIELLVDGEPLALPCRVVTSVGGYAGNGQTFVNETLIATMPRDVFARIANARVVDIRVGPTEGTLHDDAHNALRDLLAHTNLN